MTMEMIEMARLTEASIPSRVSSASMKAESARVIIEEAITTAERSKRKGKESELYFPTESGKSQAID